MTPDEELTRANVCRMFLQDKHVKAALDEIEQAMVDNIVMCPVEKLSLQNEMVNILRAKRKFVQILEAHIESGKMVEFQQNEQVRKKSFLDSLMSR